jgi:hypothetical protein
MNHVLSFDSNELGWALVSINVLFSLGSNKYAVLEVLDGSQWDLILFMIFLLLEELLMGKVVPNFPATVAVHDEGKSAICKKCESQHERPGSETFDFRLFQCGVDTNCKNQSNYGTEEEGNSSFLVDFCQQDSSFLDVSASRELNEIKSYYDIYLSFSVENLKSFGIAFTWLFNYTAMQTQVCCLAANTSICLETHGNHH